MLDAELEGAAQNAEIAATQANEATVGAVAAATNQAAIIGDVTSYAREDAERARAAADSAAKDAQANAEAAKVLNNETQNVFQQMMAAFESRLAALETKPEPQVAVAVGGDSGVQAIDPSATESAEQESHQEPESQEAAPNSSSKKRHGRRKR